MRRDYTPSDRPFFRSCDGSPLGGRPTVTSSFGPRSAAVSPLFLHQDCPDRDSLGGCLFVQDDAASKADGAGSEKTLQQPAETFFSRHFDQAEMGDSRRPAFGSCPLPGFHEAFGAPCFGALDSVDDIDDDDPADSRRRNAADLLGRLEVVLEDCLLGLEEQQSVPYSLDHGERLSRSIHQVTAEGRNTRRSSALRS